MAEVRVDQSHCNFHLRTYLEHAGWELLFKDAGRSSRGGRGVQGASLRVFEERGWPIPDLVLAKGDRLLVGELDRACSVPAASLRRYRADAQPLLAAFGPVAAAPPRSLVLLFCRTALVRDAERYFASEPACPADVLVAFAAPGVPQFSRPLA